MFDYILYRIGQFIALSLPLKMAYGVAVFFSDLHYLFADKDRRDVRENLKIIFPQKSESQIRRIRIGMFRNFAKYLADFFRFEKLNTEYLKKNTKIENVNYLDDTLAKDRGVILLSAHIGNWELGGALTALSGYKIWVIALPHKDKRVNDFFNRQRESKGLKVIPVGRAVRQCLSALNQGDLIALVGDRDFNANGAIIDFFGKPAFFPKGPAAFSLKTGAPILPVFMVRNADDTFTLKIEKPMEFTATADKETDIKKIIVQYKTIIEDYIRKYPDQWYMFKKFWISEAP